MEIIQSQPVQQAFEDTLKICCALRHEFIMPEHLLMALLRQEAFTQALADSGISPEDTLDDIREYLAGTEQVPDGIEYTPEASSQTNELLTGAYFTVESSSADKLMVPHLANSMLLLTDSYAAYALTSRVRGNTADLLGLLIMQYDNVEYERKAEADAHERSDDAKEQSGRAQERQPQGRPEPQEPQETSWRNLVTCINDCMTGRNPLIGREKELERTIQVLCRKDKNNPLHVGEPGVGKTAIVYGLAQMLNDGRVPERLKGCRIYQVDLGSLVAGTQFRGDFEKRVKQIMDGAAQEGNAIVYIDEIHNIVGAGATGEGAMDASNMLKPYLEAGNIRFIGSTTYEEYNRYLAKSKALTRRFQQIDIKEPGVDETIEILQRLKKNYERFHGVSYTDTAIDFAVKESARHISDRFLPDKAIDLMDEAGAYREMHPLDKQKRQTVDKALMADILAKMCKVDALAIKADGNAALETLAARIGAKIYGQDEAVRQVTEAVQMAKAGLTDDSKPLAALLFVGPTGVGKTEVTRVLADELGIGLVRFDMSEYTEKHTVAKLIGSPAGYVGYEDGGLLTDAIRRTPNCVLLLDEIEKAHPDIYNILLQVMDYARLTDNKGRHADFHNVVLIMTSNAGAQHAAQAGIGFTGGATAGEAMMKQVKKTFKPEFINRLSATVVFNDMDRTMASLILDKKLGRLQEQLAARRVTMQLGDDVREHLLRLGFTREYGARELDRVIAAQLKPLLMRAILFGKLKKGGHAVVTMKDGAPALAG